MPEPAVCVVGGDVLHGFKDGLLQRVQRSCGLAPELVPTAEQLRGGVRGKYAERYKEGVNIVRLDPDVAAVFPDSEAVNQALRALAEIIRQSGRRSA